MLEEDAFDIKVRPRSQAEALEAYLNELAHGRAGLPLDRGYAAVAGSGLNAEQAAQERVDRYRRLAADMRVYASWAIGRG